MILLRHHRLVGLAVATALVVIVVGMRSPAALDAALSSTLRRNDVGPSHLDPTSPDRSVTYLVVGSDRRTGIPPDIAALGELTGQRADVVMVWLVSAQQRTIRAVSLSRYLRVGVADHGTQMLAGALEYGGPAVVEATRSLVGIPIHHYVELDFLAVRNIVDAVGGITLVIPKPARDSVTHLELGAGEQRLSGDDVLAYVRSRHYEELIDGRWEQVSPGDRARIGRQHEVIYALLDRVADLGDRAGLLLTLAQNVTVDATIRVSELAELGKLLASGLSVRTDVLPSRTLVPTTEAVSPFPPDHLGTIGYHVPIEPDATVLLHELRLASLIVEEDG
jgi:LCP family protein required for cell wall assembly